MSEMDPSIRKFTMPHNNSGEGFELIYINEKQKEWLREFSSKAIAIDDTYNISRYALKLTTIITMDHEDMIRPSGFLLSFNVNSHTVGNLFSEVLKLVPEFHPKILISDEAATFWSGYVKTMGVKSEGTQRLLCNWHVLQTWKRTAKKHLKGKDLFDVMHVLHVALKSKTLADLERMILRMYTICGKSESGQVFAEYFKTRYDNRRELWSSCYRTRTPINCSSAVEAWHSILKVMGLKRRQNIRGDYLLSTLAQTVFDIDHKRSIEIAKGVPSSKSRRAICNRQHMEYERLENVSVRRMSQKTYEVTVGENVFIVETHYQCGCHQKQNYHCRFCQACYYSLSCSCTEIRPGITCHHMHAAKMFESSENVTMDDSICEDSADEIEGSPECFEIEDTNMVDNMVNNMVDNMVDNVVDNVRSEVSLDVNEVIEREENEITESSLCFNAMKLRSALNELSQISERLIHSKLRSHHLELSNITDQVVQMTQAIKISIPLVEFMEPRPEIAESPNKKDDTMREKLHMDKRKRKRKVKWGEVYGREDTDVNDVDYCVKCKLTDPPGTSEQIINWRGCRFCQLWVHEHCAKECNNQCHICSSEYEELEFF
ncbi:unnamed protein product [Caenorhabditis nigoni]